MTVLSSKKSVPWSFNFNGPASYGRKVTAKRLRPKNYPVDSMAKQQWHLSVLPTWRHPWRLESWWAAAWGKPSRASWSSASRLGRRRRRTGWGWSARTCRARTGRRGPSASSRDSYREGLEWNEWAKLSLKLFLNKVTGHWVSTTRAGFKGGRMAKRSWLHKLS